MIVCTVYLYIATFGANVRSCRGQRVTGISTVWYGHLRCKGGYRSLLARRYWPAGWLFHGWAGWPRSYAACWQPARLSSPTRCRSETAAQSLRGRSRVGTVRVIAIGSMADRQIVL